MGEPAKIKASKVELKLPVTPLLPHNPHLNLRLLFLKDQYPLQLKPIPCHSKVIKVVFLTIQNVVLNLTTLLLLLDTDQKVVKTTISSETPGVHLGESLDILELQPAKDLVFVVFNKFLSGQPSNEE